MKKTNNAVILLGSNIKPAINLRQAIIILESLVSIKSRSKIWETKAAGSSGPNFLNMAVEIETPLSSQKIKQSIIHNIETRLRRVRTADKYAPRTIDLDIILFNDQVLDNNLWERVFIALPVSELRPNLINPIGQKSLQAIALKLKSSNYAELFID